MKLKTISLLLSLCHAGSAAALGLGEINLRSSLGQPLHATIALLDASAATPADCFSLTGSAGGISPLPPAQLNIERSGGQTLLHIRTSQAMNDPFAQFVLVSDCEARLQREYVVLLDPPAQVAPPVSHDAPAVTQPTTVAEVPSAPPVPSAPRPQRRFHRAPAVAAHPSAVAAHQPATPRAQVAPPATTPRLVLSGEREHPATTDPSIALPQGTKQPGVAAPRTENLGPAELSDENTALLHKLANLEAQLVALQRRNAELEARRAAAPTTAPAPPERPAQWPLYLLAIGLLAGGGALAAWLRRRSHHYQDGASRMQPAPSELKTLSEITQGAQTESQPAPERMPEIAPPPLDEGTEVKEDILDQAEVFMAHGHGDLAVHLLQEHLRQAPTESPVPWLLLLDLLHREGNTEGYAAASAECRRYFNVNLTGHPISQDSDTGQGLEAYPHLLEQMVRVWNSPERDAFFNDLIYDNRGGTRMGFEPGAYRDILLLRAIAQEVLPLAA